MLKIKPFDEEHLKDFEYDGIEEHMFGTERVKQHVKDFNKTGVVFTGIIDGKVEGFAGLFEMAGGIGYCWAYINKAAYPHIKKVISSIRKVIKRDNYRRTQAMCINTPRARRFLEAIGFKKEGIMRKMLKDNDMVMYSILRGEL